MEAEHIIPSLHEVDVELCSEKTVAKAVKRIGAKEQAHCRCKNVGGLRMNHAKRLKQLEKETSRLERLLAEVGLDNAILREVAERNF